MVELSTAFPNSRKVHIDGPQGVRVPMREIALSGGEPPLRVYDTSGPDAHETSGPDTDDTSGPGADDTSGRGAHDVVHGLPKLREPWVAPRRSAARAGGAVTQLHYARQHEITPEMEFVAIREGL